MKTESAAHADDARESHLRSILKSITYRITGTVTTGVIVYLMTGQLHMALAISAIEPFVKIVIYYLHERAWQLVPRGTVRRWLRPRAEA